jgi:hypothetical protein
MIGGFIITGNVPKKIIIRGMGPSLSTFGISNFLADPFLQLRGSNGALLQQNDNWKDDQRPEIEGGPFQPTNDSEAVIVATLNPGSYTALLTGKGGTTGIGVVEIYDGNIAPSSQLANISTRGYVQNGNSVMIGGFSLGGGSGPTDMAVRALGPSLSSFGLANVMADPTLEMHNSNGTIMVSNDDWLDDSVSAAKLTSKGLGLTNNKESGIYMPLVQPNQFTAVLAGKNGGIGIAVVEVYSIP